MSHVDISQQRCLFKQKRKKIINKNNSEEGSQGHVNTLDLAFFFLLVSNVIIRFINEKYRERSK